MAASEDRIREVAAAYVRLVGGGGSAEDVVALYAPDARVEDPVGTEPRVGHDQIREFYGNLEGLEREARMVELRVAGGEAVFHFELTTHVGDATYTVTPFDVMTFDDDGRITSMRAFWSDADMVVS